MSEQSEALNKLALEKGILPPKEPAAPENGGGPIADLLNRDLPKVQLPGERFLLSQFARTMGRILSDKFMYRRESTPLMVNPLKKRLDQVDSDAFRSLVEQKLICFKTALHRESVITIVQTMEPVVARGTLRAPEFLAALPEVERVNTVRLPVMRAPTAEEAAAGKPGKIELLPEGYDAESRTYTFSSGIVYDETMDIGQAVGNLTSLTSEFPFGDWPDPAAAAAVEYKPSRSQAVVIAGMLTMFAVGIMPEKARKPAFIYTSNSVGSGKTLLGQMAVIPVRGSCAVTPWPGREEELKKLLEATVQNGNLYLLFDNLRGMIKSPALEAFITASGMEGRVLGGKEYFSAPNNVVVFVTGNQATVNEDMDRRSHFVELFVEEADVQSRKIAREIDETWLGEDKNRSMILSSMWALVRAWDAAGRPPNARRFASFVAWTQTIGGIVLHAGLGDCAERVPLDAGGNSEMEDVRALLVELMKKPLPRGEDYEFQTIVDVAVDEGLFEWMLTDKDLGPKEKSMFGKLLKRHACGRIFEYEDGTRLKFGHRGRRRGRRYMLVKL